MFPGFGTKTATWTRLFENALITIVAIGNAGTYRCQLWRTNNLVVTSQDCCLQHPEIKKYTRVKLQIKKSVNNPREEPLNSLTIPVMVTLYQVSWLMFV